MPSHRDFPPDHVYYRGPSVIDDEDRDKSASRASIPRENDMGDSSRRYSSQYRGRQSFDSHRRSRSNYRDYPSDSEYSYSPSRSRSRSRERRPRRRETIRYVEREKPEKPFYKKPTFWASVASIATVAALIPQTMAANASLQSARATGASARNTLRSARAVESSTKATLRSAEATQRSSDNTGRSADAVEKGTEATLRSAAAVEKSTQATYRAARAGEMSAEAAFKSASLAERNELKALKEEEDGKMALEKPKVPAITAESDHGGSVKVATVKALPPIERPVRILERTIPVIESGKDWYVREPRSPAYNGQIERVVRRW